MNQTSLLGRHSFYEEKQQIFEIPELLFRCWRKAQNVYKQNWKLFVVKPVLILYGLQHSITGSLTQQVHAFPDM